MQRLPAKATFTKESALVQNADCGFLPRPGHNGQDYLPLAYIENRLGGITLCKDRLLLREGFNLSTAVDGRKESLGIELAALLGHFPERHKGPPKLGYAVVPPHVLARL